MDLNPNSAEAKSYLGLTLNYAGRHEEAIKTYNKVIRLSPIPSANTFFYFCVACRDCGRYEEGKVAHSWHCVRELWVGTGRA